MRKLLQIGEVAQLLGMSTKAVRHYHKVGLLQEPERSASGYRLYDAQDLLRLKQIRHLQSLGLSLKHIKAVLGEPEQAHTLREILLSLDAELAEQAQMLEQRRARIQALLKEDTGAILDASDGIATLEWIKGLLGEHAEQISPQALDLEARLWTAIRNFDWPTDFRERMMHVMQNFAAGPVNYAQVIGLAQRLTALASLPEEAPEVLQLAQEAAHDSAFLEFMRQARALLTQIPPLESPFGDILGELMSTNLSPAQIRFFRELEKSQLFHTPALPDTI